MTTFDAPTAQSRSPLAKARSWVEEHITTADVLLVVKYVLAAAVGCVGLWVFARAMHPGTAVHLIQAYAFLALVALVVWAIAITRRPGKALAATAASLVVGLLAGATFRAVWQITAHGDIPADGSLAAGMPQDTWFWSLIVMVTVSTGAVLISCWPLARGQHPTATSGVPARMVGTPDGMPMPDDRDEATRRRTARHEAAHAVVALHGGGTNLHVDIRQTIGSNGVGSGGRLSFRTDHLSHVEGHWLTMQIAHAGNIVDQEISHQRDDGAMGDMSTGLTAAAGVLSTGQRPDGYTGNLSTDALMAGARQQARETLTEQRDALDALTEALLDPRNQGHLNHQQIYSTVAESGTPVVREAVR